MVTCSGCFAFSRSTQYFSPCAIAGLPKEYLLPLARIALPIVTLRALEFRWSTLDNLVIMSHILRAQADMIPRASGVGSSVAMMEANVSRDLSSFFMLHHSCMCKPSILKIILVAILDRLG